MSSMIYNNGTSAGQLSQEQFNYAMVVTNCIDIIFLIFAGLLQVFGNRIQGDVSKHTAHKTKAREYMNILQVDFDSAYSDKIITTDEMQTMSNLRTQYEAEKMQISLSGGLLYIRWKCSIRCDQKSYGKFPGKIPGNF